MEILNYTKEHEHFRQRLRNFIKKEVIPNIEEWEVQRIMPKSTWKRIGEEGFLCVTFPPEYGGQGKDFLYSVIVTEEFVKTNHNGLGPTTHSDIVTEYIKDFATREAKKKYMPGCVSGDIITAIAITEPGAGSDAARIEATAVEQGDEIIINGTKTFITNGINCDLMVVSAVDPEIENPYEALSLFLVDSDSPGFERGKKLDKMGLYSQDTAELFFTNCRIPKENRLGKKGEGFHMLMQKLQQERLMVNIFSVATAEYILEQTLEFYSKNSGSGKSIPKSQANQFSLVEMATEIKIGRTFIDKLIADHMEGKNIVVETSMGKYWNTDMVNRIATRCLDIYGELATTEQCPIARHWRDVRVYSIFAGTNEIMKSIVVKLMNL